MKRILFIIVMTGLVACTYAAETVLPVPHTVSVLPHAGQMQYNINLYHLQDPDFDMPINLTYTSDGFRPLVYSGIVGQNWSLGIGGCVTREVIGLPDDGIIYDGTIDENGFLQFLQDKHNELVALHSDAEFEEYAFTHCNNQKDVSSDIYTFSVNGHSGRFMIGLDGQARCLSGDVVKVDLSNMTIQHSTTLPSNTLLSQLKIPNESQITLTMLDGYKYVFGGSIDFLDYVYTYTQGEHNQYPPYPPLPAPTITAWHVAKIIAPNGREIHFHYQSHRLNQYSYIENGVGAHRLQPLINSRLFNTVSTSFLTPNDDIDLTDNDIPGVWHIIAEQSISKNVILESATMSDNSFGIQLTYENDSNYIFTHCHPYLCFTMPAELQIKQEKPFVQNVRIYAGDRTLAVWNLDYQEVRMGERQTPRQYLSSCATTGNIGYTFSYEFGNIGTLSGVDTLAYLDMYGYRNTATHYKLGVLQQVRDILGGMTRFEYEKTEFDSIRIFYYNGTSLILPYGASLVNSVCITGISVEDRDEHICLHKEYSYGFKAIVPIRDGEQQKSPPGSVNSHSTGILNIDYGFLTDTASNNNQYNLLGYIHTHPTGGNLLEYTNVKEKVYKENATTSIQNTYYYDTTKDSAEHNLSSTLNLSKVYSCISQSSRRAHLARLDLFDTDYNLTRRIDYTYTPVITDRYTVNATDLQCRIYHPQALVAQQIDSLFEANGTFSEKIKYTYDSLSRVNRTDTYIGDEHYFTASTYPDAMFATDTLHTDAIAYGLWMLFRKNRIKEPVETVKGFVRNNTEYVTSGTVTVPKRYTMRHEWGDEPQLPGDSVIMRNGGDRSSPLPDIDPYAAPYAILQLHLQEPATGFTPIHKQNGCLAADSRYDTVSHVYYSPMLRLECIKQIGQPAKFFIWDRADLNVITEECGNRIVSRTWLPYVGMTSETDARGVTSYYRYNALGQLVEIYRKNGNKKEVLQCYEYHYPVIE